MKNSLFRILAVLAVVLLMPLTASGAWLETFNDGFTLNVDVGEHADWFDGTDTNGSNVTSGAGLGGSVGISPGQWIFTWTAHPFNWNDAAFTDATFGMDFQSSAGGQFDDDRLGWMVTSTSNDSINFFGAQLDNTDGGIVTYWRNAAGTRVQTRIVALSGIKNSTWYRFTLEITKLAATQARLDVRLAEIDAAGNQVPGGTVLTGTVPNSSTWPDGTAPTRYFTPMSMWPAYKNFNALTTGGADNAYFALTSCSGDFDKDGDVDGKDLATKIGSFSEAAFPLATFAKQFGKSGCF